jgi:hypothetical protein
MSRWWCPGHQGAFPDYCSRCDPLLVGAGAGVKKDAIPGFVNESWTRMEEPGIYRGQCTELCGKDHGFMPVVVEVRSPRKITPLGW